MRCVDSNPQPIGFGYREGNGQKLNPERKVRLLGRNAGERERSELTKVQASDGQPRRRQLRLVVID
jgi:hypothetical protein